MNLDYIHNTFFCCILPFNGQSRSFNRRRCLFQNCTCCSLFVPCDSIICIRVSILINTCDVICSKYSRFALTQLYSFLRLVYLTTFCGDYRVCRLRTSRTVYCQFNRFRNRVRTTSIIRLKYFTWSRQNRFHTQHNSKVNFVAIFITFLRYDRRQIFVFQILYRTSNCLP